MRKLLAISILVLGTMTVQAEPSAPAAKHLTPATSLQGTQPMQEVGPGNPYRSIQDTCALPNGQPAVTPSTNSSTSSIPSSSYSAPY